MPPLDPDTALEIQLEAKATRLAQAYLSGTTDAEHPDVSDLAGVIEHLREAANGRTDLLAVAAGTNFGGWLGAPATSNPLVLLAAACLAAAGADPEATVERTDEVRANASRGTHNNPE